MSLVVEKFRPIFSEIFSPVFGAGRKALVTPAWRANGTVGAVTSGTTVNGPLPTNSEFDILLAKAICRGSSTAFSFSAGWTEIAQLTVGGNKFAWFWRRATASESAPVVTNAGRTSTNLLSAQLVSISGCKRTGTPFEAVNTNSSASGALTGVAVTAAQQHGGPWPSSTEPMTTSVGDAAMDRFLRPVSLQDMPAWLVQRQGRPC